MKMLRRWADRRRIRALRRTWESFRDSLEPALAAETANDMPDTVAGTPDPGEGVRDMQAGPGAAEDRRFLATKAATARHMPVLSAVVGRRSLEQEAAAAARDMTELMNRVPTLEDARHKSRDERDAILREWHVLYLFLAKLEGAMTGSAVDGAALRTPSEWAPRDAGAAPAGRRSRLRGMAIFAVELAIVIAFVLLVASILGFGTDDVRAVLSGRPAVEGAAVAQAPTGETEVTAPAAPASHPSSFSSSFRMPRLVQPVIARYGTVGTFVLVGAFACGLLLMFGLRSR